MDKFTVDLVKGKTTAGTVVYNSVNPDDKFSIYVPKQHLKGGTPEKMKVTFEAVGASTTEPEM